MSFETLMFDEQKLVTESGEDAFRRIAARKLREKGCQEADIDASIERLLVKTVGLELKNRPEI